VILHSSLELPEGSRRQDMIGRHRKVQTQLSLDHLKSLKPSLLRNSGECEDVSSSNLQRNPPPLEHVNRCEQAISVPKFFREEGCWGKFVVLELANPNAFVSRVLRRMAQFSTKDLYSTSDFDNLQPPLGTDIWIIQCRPALAMQSKASYDHSK